MDTHIYGVVSGLTADANYLIDYARDVGQKFRMTLRNPMPVEQMVLRICDLKQSYTQFGGQRPFGTSFIIAGWDDRAGFQLISTDPAGNFLKWRAFANGNSFFISDFWGVVRGFLYSFLVLIYEFLRRKNSLKILTFFCLIFIFLISFKRKE